MDTTSEQPTVVVGIDGSTDSRHALAQAVRSAARRGARVRAVAVDGAPEVADVVRGLVDEVLVAVAPDLLDVPEVTVEVVGGRAAEVLPRLAVDADELVIGHRGRGAVASAVLGSVGWACVLHATCPVTVVPSPPEGATTPTVVVGFDGSDDALTALRYGWRQAAWRGARLRILAACEPPDAWVSVYGVPLPDSGAMAGSLRDEAAGAADRVRATLDDDLRAVPYEVESAIGHPSTVLVDAGRDAELLVVGHRGRGSARSVLLGSQGLDCVIRARCPVTVVPTPSAVAVPTAPARAGTTPVVPLRPHPVVVGVDGSAGAELALTWALERARRTDRDVRVVRAYDPPEVWPASLIDGLRIDDVAVHRDMVAATRAQVGPLLARAEQHPVPRVEVDAVAGHPVDVLLTASDGATALVVGHRDMGLLRATVLGSTALSLLVHARCPVTVVPGVSAGERAERHPGDGPTVVVGVGGVEPARRAVVHALEEAAEAGARVLAVTGFLPVLSGPASTAMTSPTVEDIGSAIESGVRLLVEELRAEYSDRHGGVAPPVDVRVIPAPPAWAVVDAACESGAALVVLGHRGRGALATRLLGSVGHGVLLHAPCPVTMVPEPDDAPGEPVAAAPAPARSPMPLPVGPVHP